jgi:predicted hydrocarbon binding protein
VRAGRSTIKHAVDNSEDIRKLAEDEAIPKIDKLKTVLNYYAASINRPPLFDFYEDHVTYHNPICTLCDGVKGEKSFCTYICGVLEGIARHIVGFKNGRCVETLCRGKGDAECAYELYYEE